MIGQLKINKLHFVQITFGKKKNYPVRNTKLSPFIDYYEIFSENNSRI